MSNTTNRHRLLLNWALSIGMLFITSTSYGLANEAISINKGCPTPNTLGSLATVALIVKKSEISSGDFFSYWRDIHGQLATRIPGFWTYTQYHLGANIASLTKSISSKNLAIETLHGIAEVTYCRPSDVAGLATSHVTELIKQDEKNVFLSTYLYGTNQHDSKTLQQNKQYRSPIASNLDGVIVFLVAKNAAENQNQFRHNINQTLASVPEYCTSVELIRKHFFAPYQADAWQALGVNHQPPVIYDAALEFRFPNSELAIDCIANNFFPLLQQFDGGYIRDTSAYAVKARYELVKNGEATLLGLRGLPAYQLIKKIKAKNQSSSEIINVLYSLAND